MADESTAAALAPDCRVVKSEDAIGAEVGGEVVLLNTATGYFHQLNAVGSYVWRQLARPLTVAELFARAAADFDGDEEERQRDIGAFLHELRGRGLVRIEPGGR